MCPPRRERVGWGARCASIALAAVCAHATAGVEVIFDDETGVLSESRVALLENLRVAGSIWSSALDAQATLEVIVRTSDAVPTLTARSLSAVFVEEADGLSIYEQGAGYELRTGIDPNGDEPDVEITIGTSYLRDLMWFDPDPVSRETPVPADRVDAVSSFLHELAHALFMNGWLDPVTGRCFDRVASTWDVQVIRSVASAGEAGAGGAAWFCGPISVATFGGPVPLSLGSCHHLGDGPEGAGLADDVLTGVRFRTGHRYDLSALDVALARDVLGLGMGPIDVAAGAPEVIEAGIEPDAPGQPAGD